MDNELHLSEHGTSLSSHTEEVDDCDTEVTNGSMHDSDNNRLSFLLPQRDDSEAMRGTLPPPTEIQN